jgi:tRNA(His) 5'-end guanylyltransferase
MTSSLLPEQIAPYEVFADCPLISGTPLVAHLLGRRFEQRLNERSDQPFDSDFQKALLKTLSHLCAVLGCSFGYADRTDLLLYAVSQGSDARRLLSRLAGESSAKLSLLMGDVYTFDVRLFEIPSVEMARTYFQWRRELAQSAALDRYVSNKLIEVGTDPKAVPGVLASLDSEQRVEVLRRHGLDYQSLPAWQRYGSAVYTGHDEQRGAHLVIDLRLPEIDSFPDYLEKHLV